MNTVTLGILAAIGWGAADFIGGFAAKIMSSMKIVAISWIIGLVVLPLIAWFTNEPTLNALQIVYCMLAGLLASGGLVLFYHALSVGRMSLVAPITGMLTGVIPVIVAFILQGLPAPITLIGIVVALAAVLLVSNESSIHQGITIQWHEVRLPILCGIIFGLYLVLVPLGSPHGPFWPMTFSHIAGVPLLLIIARRQKESIMPKLRELPYIVSNFVLDIAGTSFFIFAAQLGRRDVATVLSSLYPGITILLAAIVLKEKMVMTQRVGVLLSLVAIGLLSV